MRYFPIILAAAIVAGCGGTSPFAMSMKSAEELQAYSTIDVCNAWHVLGKKPDSKYEQELVRRDALTAKEWDAAKREKIFIGMSEAALVCSWGPVGLYGTVNDANYGHGPERQYVYRDTQYGKAQYVYVINGRVRAWN